MMLTKSKYVDYMDCKNRMWLDLNKQSEKVEESLDDNVYVQGGIEAGEYARGMFGPYTLIESTNPEDAIQETKEALERGDLIICEATFKFNDNLCKVDILRRNNDGSYSIYEVKATTNPYTTDSRTKLQTKYINDVAYQYYVLRNANLSIRDCNIVYLNNRYVYDGFSYDYDSLYIIDDMTNIVLAEYPNIEANIEMLNETSKLIEEPSIHFASKKCKECPYLKHCLKTMNVPETNNVLSLYNDRKKFDYLNQGLRTFNDLIDNHVPLSSFNERMVKYKMNNLKPFVNEEKLKEFLSRFKFPIYFFDFETYQEAIPKIKKQRPYQQIPFQYSLHILYEDGTLKHEEYLASNYSDPRTMLVCSMLLKLGTKGTIVAYNDSFEKKRIEELALDYPDVRNELLSLLDRFIDLEDVFKKEMYYTKEISRTSIKDTLPALFPNDKSLDYHSLDAVHKGDEASKAYLSLKTLDEVSEERLRHSLLKYCELDTYAMVKIYQYLIKLV